jgi:hypothetical protein
LGQAYNSTVNNCYSMVNVNIGAYSGGGEIGGLIGESVITTLSNSYYIGTVNGGNTTGGLVGRSNGLSSINNCYSEGTINGTNGVGGLVGFHTGTTHNSYSGAIVSGSVNVGGFAGRNHRGAITNCYSTGSVSGTSNVGGFVGSVDTGGIYDDTNNYWNTQTSGQTTSVMGLGRSTSQMTYPYAANTYVGWDFDDIWASDEDYSENNGYPYLQSYLFQPSPSISVYPSLIDFWEVEVDHISSPQEYQLSGCYLTQDIIVTAPDGFKISISQDGNYTTFLSIAHTEGCVMQSIWVRFEPLIADEYGGFINNESGSLEEIVDVMGTGILEETTEQIIDIANGWNIISFNIEPDNLDALDLFSSLIDNGTLLKVQDASGNALEYLSFLEQWVNYIGDISIHDGYRLRANSDTQLTISGSSISLPLTVGLDNGWNLIGYPYTVSNDAMLLLDSLINNEILIKVLDQNGNAIEYLSFLGHWVNYIGNFLPGQGYAVNVNQDTSLIYDLIASSYTFVDRINSTLINQENSRKINYYQTVWSGNGWHHFNTYVIIDEDFRAILSPGDEIAVFYGSYCVGAAIYDNQEQYLSIISSMNDDNTDIVDGFIPGSNYKFSIWSSKDHHETKEVGFEIVEGSAMFSPGGTSVVRLKRPLNVEPDPSNHETQIKSIYPNPFNPETTIFFSIEKPMHVTLDIFNLKGQKVTSLLSKDLDAGFHSVRWDGINSQKKRVSSGIYLVRLSTENEQAIKRIMLLK